jgi:hypothetical protein
VESEITEILKNEAITTVTAADNLMAKTILKVTIFHQLSSLSYISGTL